MSESRQVRLADDQDMPKLGSTIDGRYVVKRVLGEGGFATVYACDDNRTKTQVAVKVLDPMMSRRGEFSQRFLREIETVSRLRHHNTIKIFDSGETDTGCLFLVMELLQGEDLDEILEREGPLSPERVQRISMQVLKSLMEAHQGGIMHRDLKPANVFIADIAGETDYVKVLDFGIAKSRDEEADTSLTATGQVMCSPDYVAPERVRDHACFFSSDLYSLGIMMIEMVEGELPYKGETPIMVALQHARVEDPVPLKPYTANGPLGEIIAKATDKDPAKRYQSATEMLSDLLSASCAEVPAYSADAQFVSQGGGATTAYMPGGATVTTLQPDTGEIEIVQTSNTRRYAAIAIVLLLIAAVVGGLFISLSDRGPSADESAALAAQTAQAEAAAAAEAEAIAAANAAAIVEPPNDEPIADEPVEPSISPFSINVGTRPPGAAVYVNGAFISTTPFVLASATVREFPATIQFKLEGYEEIEVKAETADALRSVKLSHEMIKLPTPSRSSRGSRSGSSTGTTASTGSGSASSSGSSSGSSSDSPSGATTKPKADPPPSDEPSRPRIGSVRVRQ